MPYPLSLSLNFIHFAYQTEFKYNVLGHSIGLSSAICLLFAHKWRNPKILIWFKLGCKMLNMKPRRKQMPKQKIKLEFMQCDALTVALILIGKYTATFFIGVFQWDSIYRIACHFLSLFELFIRSVAILLYQNHNEIVCTKNASSIGCCFFSHSFS